LAQTQAFGILAFYLSTANRNYNLYFFTMKHLVLAVAAMLMITAASAQQKIGHIDGGALLELMPDVIAAKDSIQKQKLMYQSEMENMNTKLTADYEKYMKEAESLPAAIRASREQSLQLQNQGLQDFQAQAEQDINDLSTRLLEKPVERAKQAIADVAKENGIAYVLDVGVQSVLYFDGGEDITEKVKTKLQIPATTPGKPAPALPRK
jgi:outer membrane protein